MILPGGVDRDDIKENVKINIITLIKENGQYYYLEITGRVRATGGDLVKVYPLPGEENLQSEIQDKFTLEYYRRSGITLKTGNMKFVKILEED